MFREKIGLNDIDVDSKYLEDVISYKYHESVVNRKNSREEIEERIAVGSRACYAS
jgi:hypothetical protein